MITAYSLLCYTRKPTKREEANNDDIALSMHLAIRSGVDGEWEALNENYGIFFAAAVPSSAVRDKALRVCAAGRRYAGDPFTKRSEGSTALDCDAVMPDVDITLKSLADPYLFRLKDGRFGVAATRTSRGGDPDGSESSAFLLAVSDDLTSYEQLGMVRLDTVAGVHRPRVEYDDRAACYVIRWNNDAGDALYAEVADITAEVGRTVPVAGAGRSLSDAVRYGVPESEAGKMYSEIPDIVPGNVVALSDEEASRLVERFGRQYNTGVSVPECTLPSTLRGQEARDAVRWIADTRADLEYSDGSTAKRAVTWDAKQLEQLMDDAVEGRLEAGDSRVIEGRVRQTVYPVPFAVERADPSVFAWNFNGTPMFMFIATEDENGNCIDPRGGRTHMPLRVSDSIAGLSDEAGGRAQEIDLLKCGDRNSEGRVMTGCFWAPELHVIGGKLSILFMPCFDGERYNPDGSENERAGKPDMWTGSCHIMQLKQTEDGLDLDPRDPSNWTVPEPILGPEGEALNPVQRISLDMTVFFDSGRWYYAWQQVGSIWIATFDPDRPTRLTSRPRQIVVPEFAWDNLIAEGPNVIVHDGTIFLIYSGSLVGIDYTTGLVTAPADQDADLLDPATWTKLDYPLQKSGVYNGEWQLGTGHGMWSHDEDGNLIYVFHNAEYDHGTYGGRDAQVRRVHWSNEGMPILDMQTDEELNPAYADVTMHITMV